MPPVVDGGCIVWPISAAATGDGDLEVTVTVHYPSDDGRRAEAITEVVQEFERSGHDQRA